MDWRRSRYHTFPESVSNVTTRQLGLFVNASTTPIRFRQAENAAHGRKVTMPSRHKRKLRVGVDIPTKEEATLVLNAAEGRWRPFFITAALTGIRASEMRGLIRDNVNFDNNVIHVTQRADMKRNIGNPTSEARAGQTRTGGENHRIASFRPRRGRDTGLERGCSRSGG